MCQQESKLEHRSCPHFQAWDEGANLCELNGKICLMEEPIEGIAICDIWNEVRDEWEEEEERSKTNNDTENI